MRHFAFDDSSDIRLLMMDELEAISGGEGEDGDEEPNQEEPKPTPAPVPPVQSEPLPPPPGVTQNTTYPLGYPVLNPDYHVLPDPDRPRWV